MSVLTIHLAATWFMAGLCWFVQVVHYPLLRMIPPEAVPAYERAHMRSANRLIPIVMLVEGLSAGWLAWRPGGSLYMANVAALLVIWLSTFLVQVPLHERLARLYDEKACRRLAATNWLRTIVWTARGILLLTFRENQ